jgi:hypothetical protein
MGLATELKTLSSARHGRFLLPTSIFAAICFNLIVTLTLLPVAGQSFDLAGFTGGAEAWMRWGVPLFHHWKFGSNLTLLAIGAQGCAFILGHLGMGGAAAITTAWKLPLVGANVLTALVFFDLAKRLRVPRPSFVPVLWLLSPVPIFVATGFGQVEPLTVFTFVLATDFILKKRFVWCGVVIGLGVGFEYLPGLLLIVVVFAVVSHLLSRRDAIEVGVSTLVTVLVCFLPNLLSGQGRSGLFGGLTATTSATSPGHHASVGALSSSLWSLFGARSPGLYWIILAIVLCAVVAGAPLRSVRHDESEADLQRWYVATSASILLIVVLLDPGALPQFSDLVFGGMCLFSLVFTIPAWCLILGPLFQLLGGIVWVYGGNFQSFWYDMWATTGNAGWSLPQSATAATLFAIWGAVIVFIGLLFVFTRSAVASRDSKRSFLVAVAIACSASLFLAVWSTQPAYWSEVGSKGPSLLPVTRGNIASTPFNVKVGPRNDIISASQELMLLPKPVAREARLVATIRVENLTTRIGSGRVHQLPIRASVSAKSLPVFAVLHSVWITVVVGGTTWINPKKLDSDSYPMLSSESRDFHDIHATYLRPHWVLLTYDVPVQRSSTSSRIEFNLHGAKNFVLKLAKNSLWANVGIHKMTLPVVVNNNVSNIKISAAPAPYMSTKYEIGTATGLPIRQVLTLQFLTHSQQNPILTGATLDLSLAIPAGANMGPTAFNAIGAVDIAALCAGFWIAATFLLGFRTLRFRQRPVRESEGSS